MDIATDVALFRECQLLRIRRESHSLASNLTLLRLTLCFSLFQLSYHQCWTSYFLEVTSYILLAAELFSYSYILPIK